MESEPTVVDVSEEAVGSSSRQRTRFGMFSPTPTSRNNTDSCRDGNNAARKLQWR